MKKQAIIFNLFIFFLLVSPAYAFADKPLYGAKQALKDPNISLAKALTYALEDEYLEQARYEQVIKTFGAVCPFTQLKNEEKNHTQTLLPYFKRYNIDVPEDLGANYVTTPKTLKEVFREGIEDERINIEMYEKLTSIKEFPKDILSAFNKLRSASRNHLIFLIQEQQ